MIKGVPRWWPEGNNPLEKERPGHRYVWSCLYPCGTAEDGEAIQYLQTIGQPFALVVPEGENKSSLYCLDPHSNKLVSISDVRYPAFWTPTKPALPLVGIMEIYQITSSSEFYHVAP